MKRMVWIVGAIATGASLIGCASPEPAPKSKTDSKAQIDTTGNALTVMGRVSSQVALVKARVVAVGENGRIFWAHLDAKGEFTLKLPVGQSYRVLVANAREGGGQEIIGHLMLNMARGRTQWLGARQAGAVDLGTLRPAKTPGAVTIQCSGCDDATDGDDDDDNDDDDDADHSDDGACYESPANGSAGGAAGDGDDDDDDDDDNVINVCSSGASSELEPSKTPNAALCDDDDDDDHDNDVDANVDKACQ